MERKTRNTLIIAGGALAFLIGVFILPNAFGGILMFLGMAAAVLVMVLHRQSGGVSDVRNIPALPATQIINMSTPQSAGLQDSLFFDAASAEQRLDDLKFL